MVNISWKISSMFEETENKQKEAENVPFGPSGKLFYF